MDLFSWSQISLSRSIPFFWKVLVFGRLKIMDGRTWCTPSQNVQHFLFKEIASIPIGWNIPNIFPNGSISCVSGRNLAKKSKKCFANFIHFRKKLKLDLDWIQLFANSVYFITNIIFPVYVSLFLLKGTYPVFLIFALKFQEYCGLGGFFVEPYYVEFSMSMCLFPSCRRHISDSNSISIEGSWKLVLVWKFRRNHRTKWKP